ncbi:Uncharacterised protein [Mycobacterium tuberculosis]|nr:Uncharacterised protein [Mycobacterium tuberculosis]
MPGRPREPRRGLPEPSRAARAAGRSRRTPTRHPRMRRAAPPGSSERREHRHATRYGRSQHRQPGAHQRQKQTPAQPSSTRRAPGQGAEPQCRYPAVPAGSHAGNRRGWSPESAGASRQQPGHGRCAQPAAQPSRCRHGPRSGPARPAEPTQHRAQPAAPAPERTRQRTHPDGQRGRSPQRNPAQP